jgi:transcriptional regulator with XRE-family HTH domain
MPDPLETNGAGLYCPVMKRLGLASAMRGMYKRVADRLGVDPSYVSRVAAGKRRSPKIEAELDRQVTKILALASAKRRLRASG